MSDDFKGKRVFLSGPMTGKPGWNRESFDEAEGKVLELGAIEAFNPVRYCPGGVIPEHPHEHYMLGTLHRLTGHSSATLVTSATDNAPIYDVLALLPGWQGSEGAKVERLVAEACGIEVVELEGGAQ